MNRVFYYRLVTLLLFVGGLCVFIFFISLFPSYFISKIKVDLINTKLQAQSNEVAPVPDKQTVQIIDDLDKKLKIVENAQTKTFLPTEMVIKAVIANKMPEIKIDQIDYEDNADGGKKITIGGTAPSREMLLLFRQALEDDKEFKNVDLPISNFVKGSDIKFSLTLVPA